LKKPSSKPPFGELPNKFKMSNLELEILLKGRNA
jgi:hypothetical protein